MTDRKIIDNFFKENPPKHKVFVDVGAYGIDGSNTYHLLEEGWSGILIEADPLRAQKIRYDCNGKDVKVLNFVIGDSNAEGTFYFRSNPQHNSLLADWHPKERVGESKITLRPLADVLSERNIPRDFDLLSIDTEGMDERIMRKFFESEYRPKLIITEVVSYTDLSIFKGYRQLTKTHTGYRDWIREVLGRKTYGNLFMMKEELHEEKITHNSTHPIPV
jgi:FkbM family methyltransferase